MEELPSIIPMKPVFTKVENANRGPYFVISTPFSVIPTQVGIQVP
jgi:hypothetical protein